jgi:asparagine synthase (glutamine-hydrolysing)
MCGICGVVQVGGPSREVVPQDVLERMTDVLRHRGPNDRGIFTAPGVAFGVRRLSIIDVEGGHQPFPNEDETVWGMQNGELYNHESTRAELERGGHRFRSRCDTEILPHLYEQVGDQLPARLRGKFAVAVWDGRRRRALVARDRLGVKPLYYAVAGDLVVFASELKAVLASGLVDPKLDLEAIDAYLTLGYFACPSTPFESVRKLPPGHCLVIDDEVRETAYWSFPQAQPDPTLTEATAAEELLAELEEAVKLRLMSDVPLGAMLSGGLDSSLLVALMARNMSQPVDTFSVGFVEDGSGSELGDAKLVANALGARHHELTLSVAESAVALEDLVWALDEPLADLSALGFMALSELAAQHVTVAIAGQGSDELFGGYSRHRRAALIERADRLPRVAVSSVARGLRLGGGRYERFGNALRARDAADRYLALRTPMLDTRLRGEIVRDPLRRDNARASQVVARHAEGLAGGALDETLFLDAQLGLVDDMLHYSDRVSMAHSLEVRVPFLDHHVVELAARIPASLKVHDGTTKHLVKRIARGLIPDEIIDKPKTGFFNRATETWLHAQLQGAAGDYLLADQPATGSLIDFSRVRPLVSKPKRTRRESEGLLALLMLEVWLSSFVPRALAIAAGGAVEKERAWVRG